MPLPAWFVNGTSPAADYDGTAVEDLVYDYFFRTWEITTPATLTKAKIFATTDPTRVKNRPFPGVHPHWIWVKHFTNQSDTDASGLFYNNHSLQIIFYANRLKATLEFPELHYMVSHVKRMCQQYARINPPSIQGILEMRGWRQEEINEIDPQTLQNMGLGRGGGRLYVNVCYITVRYFHESL